MFRFLKRLQFVLRMRILIVPQNYGQTCLSTNTCQAQILNVDNVSASTVTVYSLSTVGATWQLSMGEIGIVNESGNADGFQDTLTAWYY